MYDYIVRNSKSKANGFILSAILIVVGIVFIFFRGNQIIGAAILLFGIMSIVSTVKSPQRDSQTIENLRASGDFTEADEDFINTKAFLDDSLRIGNRFIYRKSYPVVIDISLIESIYAIKSNNNNGDSIINIGVTLKGGRSERLCAAAGYPDDPWVKEIIDYVVSKNPEIVVN